MSSTAKKKPKRPEIKMTRASQLRQKPLQQSNKVKLKEDLPSEPGLLRRSSSSMSALAPPPGVLSRKNRSSINSTSSMDSSCAASKDILHKSTSSITSQNSNSSQSEDKCLKSPLLANTAMTVTERLYKPMPPDPKLHGNFLRKTDRGLPEFERKMRRQKNETERPRREKVVEKTETRQNAYDRLNRKSHSNENCNSVGLDHINLQKRRNSDPKGDQAAKFVEDYTREIQNGFNRDGLHFLQKYFQESLVWLTPKVEAYLSARNLGPNLPSATNEERYIVEIRVSIMKPSEEIPSSLPPKDEVDVFVDMIDMPFGEVSIEEFSGYVIEKDSSPVVPTLAAHIGIQTDTVTFDAWTNTVRPIMVNKLVETEQQQSISTCMDDLKKYVQPQARHSVSTTTADLQQSKPLGIPINQVESTDQLQRRPLGMTSECVDLSNRKTTNSQQKSPCFNASAPVDAATSTRGKSYAIPSVCVDAETSTQDLCEDLSDSSVTPRVSPVSMGEEELELSSTYGSLSSNRFSRSLSDKINNFQKESQERGFSDKRLHEVKITSKAIMTDQETSHIHSELNRLASERIEIIELLALNILNLPSSLTVELLEAKLNYSLGETDQLLAMLEESWDLEANQRSLSHSKEVIRITQEIIRQSRAELEDSKKAISMCLDEVRHIRAGGRSRNRFFNKEVMKLKRRAEIEAFKLERMWEQFYYERTKKHDSHLRSSFSSVGKPSSAADTYSNVYDMGNYIHYLSDLRTRSLLVAAEDELNNFRLQAQFDHVDFHPGLDNWDTCSIGSASSRSSVTSSRLHKDHLVELRRQLVADTEREFPSSQSHSVSPNCIYRYPSSYHLPPSSSVWDTSLGLSSSSSISNWTPRNNSPNKYTGSNLSTTARKSTVHKSSYQPMLISMSRRDLLSPSRSSYRSAGRYSAK